MDRLLRAVFHISSVLLLELSVLLLHPQSASADQSLLMGIFDEFNGFGIKSDYYYTSQGSDGSLGIAARTGIVGLYGGSGSVNYRFDSNTISGHVGLDLSMFFLGGQLGLAWKVDPQEDSPDFGINYALKLTRMPAFPYPMFLTIGGQSYKGESEFFISYSIFIYRL
jgi:hypothetical protein